MAKNYSNNGGYNSYYTPGYYPYSVPYTYGNYNPYIGNTGFMQQNPNQSVPNMQFQQQPQHNTMEQNNPQTSPASMAYVNGIEGAKAYILPPNSCILLMDSDNPMFYIKTTNAQGQGTLKYFKIEEIEDTALNKPVVETDSVTRQEFDVLKNRIEELSKIVDSNKQQDTGAL